MNQGMKPTVCIALLCTHLAFAPAEASSSQQPRPASTLTVLNTDDSGAGSLRQAIADADAGDTIVFSASLSGATIRLQQTVTDTLNITRSLTIDGSALAERIIISGDSNDDGGGDVRVMSIDTGTTVTLKNLTITKGSTAAAGGGIYNSGNLTLLGCVVSNNTSGAERGGGILSLGPLSISATDISDNTSAERGAGIAVFSGPLTISDSTISGNNSAAFGGGIWISPANADPVSISNTSITNNKASSGGGIYNDGAAVALTDVTVSGNAALVQFGGGLHGGFAITDSVISGNTATIGAGIYSGNLAVSGSTISDNTAIGDAGGIYVASFGSATLSGSTLSGNESGSGSYGGAILNRSNATTTLINSTLSGNIGGYGGGVFNQPGAVLDLRSVTLSGNESPNDGGIGGLSNFGATNMVNTLIANSVNGDCGYDDSATFPIRASNIVQDGRCFSAAIDDVRLGPLADNGGPTMTHALLVGSPAIDRGTDSYCDDNPGANNLDQRGVVRPVDGDLVPGAQCDIGAFEFATDVFGDGFE